MSVAAQTWAWAQHVPIRPKFILVTLADQADERTGKVCYQRTDAKFLAAKCGVPERSLYRYLGALILNGYVTRSSGKKKGHASEYWLCLDRVPAESMDEFVWSAADDVEETEPQDIEGSATLADPRNEENTPENGRPGPPYLAEQESLEKPKIPLRARESAPRGFSRHAQDLERGIVPEGSPPKEGKKDVFVIENSRAWDAWCAHNRSLGKPGTFPTCWGTGEYAKRRGWNFPTLFPVKVHDPPAPSDLDEIAIV